MLENERRMVEVDGEIKALKTKLKELEDEKEKLTEAILDAWLEAGVDSMRVDGATVYCHTRTFALLPQGSEAAIDVLKSGEYSDVVQETVNLNTLSALVRELNEINGTLPPEWEGVIGAGGDMSIRVRKS